MLQFLIILHQILCSGCAYSLIYPADKIKAFINGFFARVDGKTADVTQPFIFIHLLFKRHDVKLLHTLVHENLIADVKCPKAVPKTEMVTHQNIRMAGFKIDRVDVQSFTSRF